MGGLAVIFAIILAVAFWPLTILVVIVCLVVMWCDQGKWEREQGQLYEKEKP